MIEVLRSGQLSLGPPPGRVRAGFAAPRVRLSRAPSAAAPRGSTWRCGRSASATATRSSRARYRSWPPPTRRVRARPAGVRGHRSGDAEPRPRRGGRRRGQRTRALLPVHIFGYPAEMPAFERIAERHDVAIVEDACEALGARPRGRHRRRLPAATRLRSASTPTSS